MHEAGITTAARLAERLRARDAAVAPRGDSTLVSWRADDPADAVLCAAEAGVIVRTFLGEPWVRASCGAWTSEDDLDRLLATVG